MKFNINHEVRVRLTPRGRNIILSTPHEVMPTEDANGWSKWQLWELMRVFGSHCYNGCEVPFETEIEMLEANL